MDGIMTPLFANYKKRGELVKMFTNNPRFQAKALPELAHGQVKMLLFINIYEGDLIPREEMLKKHPDLHSDAQHLMKGVYVHERRGLTMVEPEGKNYCAQAYELAFHPPENSKVVTRIMIPTFQVENAFDKKGALQVHHQGISRYQGVSLYDKVEKLDEGGEKMVRRASEFAFYQVPLRVSKGKTKPKFWAMRENGMVVTDENDRPVLAKDGKGRPDFVEIDPKDPPFVAVLTAVTYRALIGIIFPDMRSALHPILESINGGPLPDRFERDTEKATFQAKDPSEYIEDDPSDKEEVDDTSDDETDDAEESSEGSEEFEAKSTAAHAPGA